VSVDMNYNVSSAGGSGAQTLDVATALKTYFDYASSVQGVYRTSYTSTAWTNLLKAELDAGRPMQYAGTGSGGGHSFVCDGYDNQNYFHFNWGWGGSSDGYFITSALNPGSLGTGGGSGGFNTNQRAIIGIRPNQAVATAPSLRLNSAITISPNPIQYQQAFTVNAGILNTGNGAFVGDLGAALFDASGNFVSWVQTRAETSGLQPNGTYSGGHKRFECFAWSVCGVYL
jgi:Peptidase C10 family